MTSVCFVLADWCKRLSLGTRGSRMKFSLNHQTKYNICLIATPGFCFLKWDFVQGLIKVYQFSGSVKCELGDYQFLKSFLVLGTIN